MEFPEICRFYPQSIRTRSINSSPVAHSTKASVTPSMSSPDSSSSSADRRPAVSSPNLRAASRRTSQDRQLFGHVRRREVAGQAQHQRRQVGRRRIVPGLAARHPPAAPPSDQRYTAAALRTAPPRQEPSDPRIPGRPSGREVRLGRHRRPLRQRDSASPRVPAGSSQCVRGKPRRPVPGPRRARRQPPGRHSPDGRS